MARKDRIFERFMQHPVLQQKYGLTLSELPSEIIEGDRSEELIVKTITLIVKELESKPRISDAALQKKVTSFLNNNI
tara:strand:- start:53 stop:283 length:231 start_codon:yes stop_codon:yes gene_type:complete